MPVYSKLVRDRIPEIIKADGQRPVVRKLNMKEYKEELLKKLSEEVEEVIKASDDKKELIKELGDVQEVMLAMYDAFKIECSDVTNLARKRRKERGGFSKRIFLKKIEK